ncbi:hypothetical protein [Nigerium massiliense]|uniref:hypothetical protein n=1 Tax=Nigerium massiliense TaxID=1522317 RepID=UPI00058E8F97|nr:hypothetical protein [Nigerium massiliense]
MSQHEGPIDETVDLINGNAAIPEDEGLLGRIVRGEEDGDERKDAAEEAADLSVGSVNEPAPDTDGRSVAESADASVDDIEREGDEL